AIPSCSIRPGVSRTAHGCASPTRAARLPRPTDATDLRNCSDRGKTMATLVSLRNLHKKYRRGPETIDVLHGIDLDIDKGDFAALMGPSGSGKTTLLNLIGGLD